jgi:hypothetical protein
VNQIIEKKNVRNRTKEMGRKLFGETEIRITIRKKKEGKQHKRSD